jgi:adenylylsulfate kinase
VSLRYEDLVARPEEQLARIVDAVGRAPTLEPVQVVEAVTFDALRREAPNGHFWQGRSGHWQELLPARTAMRIARPYSGLLRQLGYAVDPDRLLTDDQALARWHQQTVDAPARDCRPSGFAVWLTGLPSAGKSTLATLLSEALVERGVAVEVLDADVFRRSTAPELGFNRADRERNVDRLARRAAEMLQARKAVLIAAIAPFESSRSRARASIEQHGRFVEVHVDAPVELCIERDPKGHYRQALAGTLPQFTGISDPYETPTRPDIRVDTALLDPARATAQILAGLIALGLLPF